MSKPTITILSTLRFISSTPTFVLYLGELTTYLKKCAHIVPLTVDAPRIKELVLCDSRRELGQW
jgi:hypothetical protein